MMLPDITTYYSNESSETPHNQYRRKYEVDIEVIAKCYTCGSLLTAEHEIIVDNLQTFCSGECVKSYEELMEDISIVTLLSNELIDTRKMKPTHYEYGFEVEKELHYDCRPYLRNGVKVCRSYIDGIGFMQRFAIYKLR